MKKLTINHLAVWTSIIAASVIGFLWYGPIFGEKWMELEGLIPSEVEANPPGAAVWITNLIATIVPMYVLAWLFTKLDVQTGLQGATYGFAIAFSFVLLSRMTNDMFAGNDYVLSWIVGGMDTVVVTLAGFVLGSWKRFKK